MRRFRLMAIGVALLVVVGGIWGWADRSEAWEFKAHAVLQGPTGEEVGRATFTGWDDRTSAATMRANQLRLWFASMAYVLICAMRRIGLAETTFADATCGTIRLKLLKIGTLVRISCRRIKIAMASACPAAEEWGRAARRLAEATKATSAA